MDWNWYPDKHDSEMMMCISKIDIKIMRYQIIQLINISRFTLERHFVTVCFVVLYRVSKFIGYCSKKCD